MAVVNLIDRYAAVTRAGLADAERRRGESRPPGGDSRFAALLEQAMVTESSGVHGVAEDNLDLLRQEFRQRMITTMLNHLQTEAAPSRRPWPPLPAPGGNEVAGAPSNNRQVGVSTETPGSRPNLEGDLGGIIELAARRYEVDPLLIKSVIRVESGYNAGATSPKGAMGLMQLMPATASDLGVVRPYDPEENIMGGTRYLKMLMNRYGGDLEKALAAYNWGMGNLENRPERMPSETRNYVARVLQHYGRAKA
ncbi:MAG: lytic transglycosylase domain-containing protein [Pseudomonadota bacterium]|nr:lytic transglycosylase domain-containing protein [Pseudomonadota bacterium]